MRTLVRFVALLLSFAVAIFAAPAFSQNSPQVVVTSASADSKLAVLVIFGRNFTRVKTLQVSLSGFGAPLTIAAFNDTQITTLLPTGISPGSYWATVGEAKGGNQDRIAVTLGAQGAPGPAGSALSDISALNGVPCFSTQVNVQGLSFQITGHVAVNVPQPVITVSNDPANPGFTVGPSGPITFNCVIASNQPPPSGTPPGTYDPLATTSGTVLAALAQLTVPQDWPVPGNCGAMPSINCVNGTSVTTYVHAAPVGTPAITQLTPLSFGFTLEMSVATVSPISISNLPPPANGTTCLGSLDTGSSGSPTMHVAGTAVFDSDPTVDPPNRITMTNVAFTGIEPTDVSFTGDAACVTLMTQAASQFISLFEQQFAVHLGGMQLCGAPGPGLFEACQ